MNIKQIKYFVSVTEQGSFSSAAREQHVSVQAISKAMADLEKGLPCALFIKTHRGISLTSFGNAFLRKAEAACATFEELEAMAGKGHISTSNLTLFLCAPAFSHSNKARASIEEFIHHQLSVEAKVSIGSGEQGLEALKEATCDALMTIGMLKKDGLDCFPMGTVPTGICMAKNHPLASQNTVSLQDICAYPVLSSIDFDHFNESVLALYQKEDPGFTIVEPSPNDQEAIERLFYSQNALIFMANIVHLGEILPNSVLLPIAPEDDKVVPLCLITCTNRKTAAYLRLEHLFSPQR